MVAARYRHAVETGKRRAIKPRKWTMTPTIIGEQHLHENGTLDRDAIVFRDPEGCANTSPRRWRTSTPSASPA